MKKNQVRNKADIVVDDDDFEDFDQEKFNQQEQEAGDYLSKIKKRSEVKELEAVDHTKLQYMPIRKNFYIESKEIKNMTHEQVEDYRKKLGDIQVRGKDVARPIRSWYECGLSEVQIRVLTEVKKYPAPFAI